MSRGLFIYVLFLAFFTVSGSSACAPYPVGVRIGNVSLSTGKVTRGVALSVGDPPQSFAVLPLWPLNNTFLYGVDGHCLEGSPGPGKWTSTGCTTFRGGAYDPLASKTRRPGSTDQIPSDGTLDTLGNGHYPRVTEITDTLRLNNNVTFQNYPMGVALNDWGPQGYLPMAAIGLGPASVLLEKLKSTGSIGSRSWSFFWGQSNPSTTQLDGSLIFGGYDRAKVAGQKYTFPLTKSNPDCQSELVVTVSDLVLNFSNGTDASLFPLSKSSAISMCITPSLPALMRLPFDPYVNALLDLTKASPTSLGRSLGMYFWNLQYTSGADPYKGDMTIKFQSGLSIRVPNSQIVVPHTSVNQTTGVIDVNFAAPDLVIDSLQEVEATKMAHLGWEFLSSAYMHVNQDAGQFYLWAANPTADQDLVAVDTTGKEVASFCAGGSTTKTAGPSASSTDDSRSSSSPNNTRTIVGVVIGSVVAIVALAGLVFWWFKRRRRTAVANKDRGPLVQGDIRPPTNITGGPEWKHELQDRECSKSELEATSRAPQYELPG